MSKQTAGSPRETRGIKGWLGLGGGPAREPDEVADDTPGDDEEASAEQLRETRRARLMADITRFLCSHRLEVRKLTLTFAHDVITGADQRLSALIEERVGRREPITIAWIEELRRGDGAGDPASALVKLIGQIEGSVDEFGETTRAARSATSRYSSALTAHVGTLDQAGADVTMSDLTDIAKSMLERTRELEEAMQQSEAQAGLLRTELETARREASCDALTGLPNRRAFEAEFAGAHAHAKTTGEPLSVAFCDVDHFKRVNDTHGHDAGDRVLREVATTLSSISNDRCCVARHGGEEFVVLFRGKSLEEAHATLDGARELLAARRLINRKDEKPFGQITFSAGIADVMSAASSRAALASADAALLRAKSEGRNRVYLEA